MARQLALPGGPIHSVLPRHSPVPSSAIQKIINVACVPEQHACKQGVDSPHGIHDDDAYDVR